MGQGRSHVRVKEIVDDFEEIILCNMEDSFIHKLQQDPEIIDILKNKKCILFCNASKSGFTPLAFDTFNVHKCVVNRVKPTPNWELWKLHKATQGRGVWYHNDEIPAYTKDLPYFFKWRGPGPQNPDGSPVPRQSVNYPNMQLSNGYEIEHLSEDVEMYLFEPTRDRLETNMGLYFTALYSIVDLKKTKLNYVGVDFYDTVGDGEGWRYHNYDRIKMEAGHMKILADNYLAKYFPNVDFNFYTKAEFNPTSENVRVVREMQL